MFLFGIFGVGNKSRELRSINNVTCKKCGKLGVYKLVKQFSYFHFFFIPIFKWGEKYYVTSRCCKSVFSVSAGKGRQMEQEADASLEEYELTYLYGEEKHSSDYCPYCRREIDKSFEYCPYCGNELIIRTEGSIG